MKDLLTLFSNDQLLVSFLLIANVLDVVTGLIKAIDSKSVSSKAMKHGAWSKVMIWAIVFVSGIVSAYLKTDLTSYVIGYYLVMEVVSILENASQFIPVPAKLKDILKVNEPKPNTKVEEPKAQPSQEILDYMNKEDNK